MQWTPLKLVAALALLGTPAHSHMIMKSPVPYSADSLDNSPLTPSNYPCKSTGQASFYSRDGITNKMAIGEPQTLSFEGSAVHGGGSCQLALSDDLEPSESTSWQVILSIQGGCPSKDGSGPSEYEFTIPDSISPGQYSFAWTWISKLSGTQEYYMNCAPVEVTGGSAKRSANETSALAPRANLPELFVANLAGINSCKTTLSTDPKFPEPGPKVESYGNPSYGDVTGSNCVPKGLTERPVSEGPGSGSSPTNGGSDDGGDDSCDESPAPSPSASPDPSSSPPAPPSPTSSIPVPSGPAATPSPSSFPTPPNSGGGSGGSGGKSGACSSEGMFNCDGSSYQQCAAGSWTAMQDLPPGTSCVGGESQSLWAGGSKRWARTPRRQRRQNC